MIDSGSMWSLTLRLSGAERWVMTLHEPSCLGMTPSPEQLNGVNGGAEKGPAILPAEHSL